MATEVTRRSLLSGAGVALVAGVAGYIVARNSDAAKPRANAAANAYGAPSSGGRTLVAAGSVPRGGGVVLSSADVVVTRDDGGAVHGFSATCTHQGCTVVSVSNGSINCPCHGSRFDSTTGAPVSGPASTPLPAVAVVERNGQVVTA